MSPDDKTPSKWPLKLVIGLFLAIALDTGVQLSWKMAAESLPDHAGLLTAAMAIFKQPLFLVVGALLVGQIVNWLKVLNHADLSFAQPFTALSYVSVLGLSALWLGEKISLLQVLGIACIFVGVWFISRTDHATSPHHGDQP